MIAPPLGIIIKQMKDVVTYFLVGGVIANYMVWHRFDARPIYTITKASDLYPRATIPPW